MIPAGGQGRRLWPCSSVARPKFLWAWSGGDTLAQATARRLVNLCQSLTFVSAQSSHDLLQTQIHAVAPSARIISEPSPRNSLPAIALGAAFIANRFPSALIGSFPIDHIIAGKEVFARCVGDACAAADKGFLVTIGIPPATPATGYGYIEKGETIPGLPTVLQAKSFTEKPSEPLAEEYLNSGEYLWNAGIFVARAEMLLEALEAQVPGCALAVRELARDWDTLDAAAKAHLWERLVAAPIDTVLAQPLASQGKVAVVPAPEHLGWADVGDWDSLYHHLAPAGGTLNLGGKPLCCEDSEQALVYTESLAGVSIVGIPDAVVVESGGKLLVTTRKFAQNVKNASVCADKW